MLYLKFSVSLSLVIRIMKHKRVSTFVAAFKQFFLARAENSRGSLDIRIKANKGNRNKGRPLPNRSIPSRGTSLCQ